MLTVKNLIASLKLFDSSLPVFIDDDYQFCIGTEFENAIIIYVPVLDKEQDKEEFEKAGVNYPYE